MPLKEALFWISITVFGTGLYFVPEHKVLAVGMIVFGLLGVAYSVFAHHYPDKAPNVPIWLLLMIITWAALGYDIYDRQRKRFGYDPKTAWDDTAPMVQITGQTFANESVLLDGRYFLQPTFKDVTFVYNGTGPVRMDQAKFFVHKTDGGHFGIKSSNKVVEQSIQIAAILDHVTGCQAVSTTWTPKDSVKVESDATTATGFSGQGTQNSGSNSEWRSVNPSQRRAMIGQLEKLPPRAYAIVLAAQKGKHERIAFASALLDVFHSQGWSTPPAVGEIDGDSHKELDHAGVTVLDFSISSEPVEDIGPVTNVLAAAKIPHTEVKARWGQAWSVFQFPSPEGLPFDAGRFNPQRAVWVYVGPREVEP